MVFATGIYSIGTRDCRGEEGGREEPGEGEEREANIDTQNRSIPFLAASDDPWTRGGRDHCTGRSQRHQMVYRRQSD